MLIPLKFRKQLKMMQTEHQNLFGFFGFDFFFQYEVLPVSIFDTSMYNSCMIMQCETYSEELNQGWFLFLIRVVRCYSLDSLSRESVMKQVDSRL